MAMLWSSLAAHAQDEVLIRFHTNVPEKAKKSGVAAQVSFVLGSKSEKADVSIDYGSGDTEVEIKKAIVENDNGEQTIKGTLCTSAVTDAGWVTISGDPDNLYFFNASGNEIDQIQFNDNLKLQVLNLEHNNLKSLNIDRLQSLNIIYLQDNPFSATTPLMIGRMPNLMVLEVPQIGHISPNFTLKNFPNLRSFDAYHTISLKTADPTGCPYLQRLSLDMTSVESVDLSKNPELQILNVGDSRVKTLDLSHNPKITQLYISHSSGTVNTDVKFETIDVSHCPELYYFYCGGNNLKELDLRSNPKLFTLSCDRNLLRKLDVSQNPALYSVNVRYNYMDFATLPEPGNWFEYYHEQNPMELNDTYKVGDVIDLSKRVLRANTTTQARLYRVPKADPTKPVELDDSYYSYEAGKVTLKKALDEEVFVQFTNSRLRDYPIRTENFRVKTVAEFGKDVKAVEMSSLGSEGSPVNMSVGILGATAANPVTVKVDLGDGETKPFQIKEERPATANIATKRTGAGNIIIYVPQDKYVTSLESDGQYIDNIDLSALTELRILTLKNAGLTTIDLSYNNKLEKLDLSYNQLNNYFTQFPDAYKKDCIVMTTKNIGKQKQLALDFIYNKRLTSWWDVSANVGAYYFINHLDYESYREDYRRPSCNLSLSNDIQLPAKVRMELSARYASKRQGRSYEVFKPSGSIDIGLSKRLLRDRLSLSLMITDLLHTERWDSYGRKGALELDIWGHSESRQVIFRVHYNFGSRKCETSKNKVKEAERL